MPRSNPVFPVRNMTNRQLNIRHAELTAQLKTESAAIGTQQLQVLMRELKEVKEEGARRKKKQ